MKWYGTAFAVVGALAAIRATTVHAAVVLAVTAAVAGGLWTVGVCTGALRIRRRGEPLNWARALACLPTFYLAAAALSGWQLSEWHGILATVAQSFNGGSLGVAVYALWRRRRSRRLALATH